MQRANCTHQAPAFKTDINKNERKRPCVRAENHRDTTGYTDMQAVRRTEAVIPCHSRSYPPTQTPRSGDLYWDMPALTAGAGDRNEETMARGVLEAHKPVEPQERGRYRHGRHHEDESLDANKDNRGDQWEKGADARGVHESTQSNWNLTIQDPLPSSRPHSTQSAKFNEALIGVAATTAGEETPEMEAAFVQTRGVIARNPCKRCSQGRGLWKECIERVGGNHWTSNGTCQNCYQAVKWVKPKYGNSPRPRQGLEFRADTSCRASAVPGSPDISPRQPPADQSPNQGAEAIPFPLTAESINDVVLLQDAADDLRAHLEVIGRQIRRLQGQEDDPWGNV
ncbi:DUF3716 domain-containing protein [Aspergillus mulundensis]|uniref:Uncharacterized protein n=1 Tax=Aspergillus mulundensis TaxID=1810919 RepID=A0A3D8RZF7_9EURO|nr:hypothetical protein DSM5745_06073 [Aspergillus mulundensis]RDW79221.1 hypothetical protein DSM5745_06073 [Aspergillus mulundensis]